MKWKLLFLTHAIISTCFLGCRPKGDTLPAFNLLLLDSTTILNTTQIPEGKPFLLIYFQPDCDQCQRETKSLMTAMDSMKNTKFYFVTSARFDEMKTFSKEYKLDSHDNILVGRDYQLYIFQHFKEVTTPYLVIYDKNKIQRAVFAGEHEANKILEIYNKIAN